MHQDASRTDSPIPPVSGAAHPHVTLLCSRYWPERYGGVEERIWNVSHALARAGCEVDVLTENRVKAAPSETLGDRLHVVRYPPFAPGIMWRWYYQAQVRWWFGVLRRRRPTGFIWATDPTMAVAALLLGYRRRLIYNPADCVGGMDHIQQVYPHITTLHTNRALRWCDRLAYRWSRWVVVSSENVRSQFQRFYRSRHDVFVCPHGVEVPSVFPDRADARALLNLPASGFVAGFVGRLDGCKGVEYLLQAAHLADLGPDDRILIAGSGPDEDRLRAIAGDLGIEARVVWAGRTNEPSNVYAASDVFVLPSVFEAFGLVLLESMAAGRLCLARSADGIRVLNAAREVIRDGETGFVTDTTDPQSLADRLAWLRARPEACEEMGRKARDYARGRTWDRLAGDYFDAIPSLRPAGGPSSVEGEPVLREHVSGSGRR